MRQGKYRVWDVDEKCWIPEEYLAIKADGTLLTKQDEDSNAYLEEIIHVEISWAIGLKDKNRVEIYEGDIITYGVGCFPDGKRYVKGYIKHYKLGYRLFFERHLKQVCTCGKCSIAGSVINLKDILRSEVIGNIYENPERLK